MMARRTASVFLGSAVLALVVGACTSNDDAHRTWTTNPRGAREVTSAELDALKATGTLVPIAPDKWKVDAERRAAEAAEDQRVIDRLLAAHPELQSKLEAPPPGDDVTVLADGNHEIMLTMPDGASLPIQLMGDRLRKHNLVQAYKRFNTIENQTAIYRAMFPLLSDACASGLPAPDAIGGLSVADLKAHNKAMATCAIGAAPGQGSADPEPPAGRMADRAQYKGASPPSAEGPANDSGGGVGIDSSKCSHLAGGIFEKVTWAGKWYDTSIKWQGRRGSCVSFGIVSALEQSASRLTGEWIDLDEQSVYATAKVLWAPDDFEDGLVTTETVKTMVETGYVVPFENAWPYNPSSRRLNCHGDKSDLDCSQNYTDPDYYQDSCVNYNYTCSETTHQAQLVCHDGDCFYFIPLSPLDNAYKVAAYVELVDIEDPQSATVAQAFINMGFGVVVGTKVYKSFQNVGNDGTYAGKTAMDTYRGTHAMHASGVVFNHQLPSTIPPGGGGGYVALKNSWGCSADGGYFYMSFDAAQDLMYTAVAILPSTPLQNVAPKIEIVEPADGASLTVAPIQSETHLVAKVSDFEDRSGCCGVTWYADDAVIGHGTTLDAMLPVKDACASRIRLAAVATDSGGKTTRVERDVSVAGHDAILTVSSPISNETFYRGVTYLFDAQATDTRGMSLACDEISWLTTAGNALKAKTGCQVPAVFDTNGDFVVSIHSGDPCGLGAAVDRKVHVIDAPPTAPPVVTILSPAGTAASPFTVMNPTAALPLQASAASPGGFALTYTWGARNAGSTGAFTPLGSSLNFTWTNPSQQFPFSCGGRTIEIQLCATDANGMTCKSSFVRLTYPTC